MSPQRETLSVLSTSRTEFEVEGGTARITKYMDSVCPKGHSVIFLRNGNTRIVAGQGIQRVDISLALHVT